MVSPVLNHQSIHVTGELEGPARRRKDYGEKDIAVLPIMRQALK